MTAQPMTLWSETSRLTDPDTCVDSTSQSMKERCYAEIRRVHHRFAGLTDAEMLKVVDQSLTPSSVIRRRADLVEAGELVKTDARRINERGVSVVVWGLPTQPEADLVARFARGLSDSMYRGQ